MKKRVIFLLCLTLPLLCLAQKPLPREYEYDRAGNRTLRKVIALQPAPPAPPKDSTITKTSITEYSETEYFIEKIAQMEVKVYPNPATEKITLNISTPENLQTGILQLYSLSGQLLKEQTLHSAATEISLAGLAKGAYILKVQINNTVEEWKIIKQ